MARLPASLMCLGVGKLGCPTSRRIAPDVRRIRSRLNTPEAEPLVVALELAPAGQIEDDACFASEESFDHCGPDLLPLPLGEDGDRGQFTASVAMRLDLAHTDHLSILLGNHEIGPSKVHPRQTYLGNEASDCGLVVLGRGTDGDRHPGASRLSRGPPTQPKECRTPPAPSSTSTTTPSTRCSMGPAASTRLWRLRPNSRCPPWPSPITASCTALSISTRPVRNSGSSRSWAARCTSRRAHA